MKIEQKFFTEIICHYYLKILLNRIFLEVLFNFYSSQRVNSLIEEKNLNVNTFYRKRRTFIKISFMSFLCFKGHYDQWQLIFFPVLPQNKTLIKISK